MGYFPVNPLNKRPLVKDWPNYEGKAEGTYGYALPKSIIVVDVDPRNGGDATEASLLMEGLLPETKIVTTASGGRHYYYKNPTKCRIHKKLAAYPGIDFLSKGQYVIGENSVIKGVTYVSNEQEIVAIDKELLTLIRQEQTDDKLDELLPISLPDLNIEDLKRLVSYLGPDYYNNYDKWCNVGMCLHHATKGSLEGLNVWDNWSVSGKNYQIGATSKKWPTFNLETDNKKPLTVATLIKWAMKNGYVPDDAALSLAALNNEIPQRSEYDLLQEVTSWVYINDQTLFFNIQDKRMYAVEKMRLYYRKLFPKGDVISRLIQSDRMVCADSLTYAPGEGVFFKEGGLIKINEWFAPNIEPREGDVSIFEDHLKWIVEEEWEIIRNWMAYVVQFPKDRVNWALLLTGGQGIGKSFLGQVLTNQLGLANVSSPSNQAIHEKYTGWYAVKQLVVINELMATGRKELMNKLKQVLTEDVIPVRMMYRQEYSVKAYCSMLLFSNYDTPILLDQDDRRFCVLKSYKTKRDKSYYKKLWDWMKYHTAELRHYFLNVDLSKFSSKEPPATFAKAKLLDESNHGGIEDLIHEYLGEHRRTIFTLEEVIEYLNSIQMDDEYFDGRRVSNILRRNYQFLKRLRMKGKLVKIYAPLAYVKKYNDLKNEEIVKIIIAETTKK